MKCTEINHKLNFLKEKEKCFHSSLLSADRRFGDGLPPLTPPTSVKADDVAITIDEKQPLIAKADPIITIDTVCAHSIIMQILMKSIF